MNEGHEIKRGMADIFRHLGGTMIIHRNRGSDRYETFEIHGLKNSEKHNPKSVFFEFPEAVDIRPGDEIQQKGAREIWSIREIEDNIIGDAYVSFKVYVGKGGAAESWAAGASNANVVFNAPVFGAVQVASNHSFQSVTMHQATEVYQHLDQLRGLLKDAPLSELDKEDAEAALKRIEELSTRPKSPDVVKRINERLTLFRNIIGTCKDMATLAAPYLDNIADYFQS